MPNEQRQQTAWTRREIDALLRVTNAVTRHEDLAGLLDLLVKEAYEITDADGSSILLRGPRGALDLVADRGVGQDYTTFLRSHFIRFGPSGSRRVVESGAPLVVRNIETDRFMNLPDSAENLRKSRRGGVAAAIIVPLLVAKRRSLGTMSVYGVKPTDWSIAEVEFMSLLGQHAGAAIEQSRMMDSKRRQLKALERLVTVLRDQTHEYANRLHALSGLLALGETAEAQQFLSSLVAVHHENYGSVIERINDPIIVGLLVAQMGIGRQRAVEIRLHRASRVDSVPSEIIRSELVTILGNLVQNAIEATVGQEPHRRRIMVRISQTKDELKLVVRDRGAGIDEARVAEMFDRGVSGKRHHAGIGLSLVAEAVSSLEGEISVEAQSEGTTFRVRIPISPSD